MTVELGLTEALVNTQYAPLAAILVHYQHKQVLQPLQGVELQGKIRDFNPSSKLIQLFLSILAGCDTLSEVNSRLKHELALAQGLGWCRFADQSNLSRLLDGLTQKQLEQLRAATTQIWRSHSQTLQHDWRGYLWLDYDLSGLPCSLRAEASQKGYFSDKKTRLDVNWSGLVPSSAGKRSGRMSCRAMPILSMAYSQLWKLQKLL
jgi:hypothetical protein